MRSEDKSRTLLIFPPSTVFKGDPTVPATTPPLGLAYLAAYLKKHNFPVKILDAVATGGRTKILKGKGVLYGLTDQEIAGEIMQYNPAIVGITCPYTAYAGDAHRVAAIAKEVNAKILVVFGGAHPTIFPEFILKDKNVDQVVMGEGEETLLALVRAKERGADVANIFGTVVRRNGKIIRNIPREPIKNLDCLPPPAWHLLPMDKYLHSPDYRFSMRALGLPMITSRGCPGHCIYCSIHSVWGHIWRGRTPKNVVDEMEMLQKDYGVKEVFFFDDSMGADKKRLEAICDEILGRKLDIKWTTPNGIAHWTLDENLLLKMKRAGCYRITFGIESGNPDIRRYIGKSYSLDQARRLIKFANKIGLWTICTFIIGFPPETRQQIEETVAFAINSETDLAIFYLLCPHPGTKVYDDFKNLGLLDLDYLFSPYVVRKPEDWAMAGRVLAGRGVPTKHFTIEELQEIVSRAYNQFFKKRLLSFILNPQKLIYKIHSYEDMKYMFKNGYYGSGLILKQLLTKSFYSQNLRNNSKN